MEGSRATAHRMRGLGNGIAAALVVCLLRCFDAVCGL